MSPCILHNHNGFLGLNGRLRRLFLTKGHTDGREKIEWTDPYTEIRRRILKEKKINVFTFALGFFFLFFSFWGVRPNECRRRNLGDICERDSQCQAEFVECINGTCSCQVGFLNVNQSYCVKSRFVLYLFSLCCVTETERNGKSKICIAFVQ